MDYSKFFYCLSCYNKLRSISKDLICCPICSLSFRRANEIEIISQEIKPENNLLDIEKVIKKEIKTISD